MKTIEKTVAVGASKLLAVELQTKLPTAATWSDTTATSATVLIYAVGEDTVGTVDAGSTTSAVADAARTEATDFWNGMPLTFQDGDNVGLTRIISDFVSGTLTLDVAGAALVAAPATGDQYVIRGYPIVSKVAVSPSGNTVSYQITAVNGGTSVAREVMVVFALSYTNGGNTDIEYCQFRVNVE